MATEVATIEEVKKAAEEQATLHLPNGRAIAIWEYTFVPADYAGRNPDEVFVKIHDEALILEVDKWHAEANVPGIPAPAGARRYDPAAVYPEDASAALEAVDAVRPARLPLPRRCEATPLLVCRTVR